jgi:hypothetical protein
VSAKVLFGLEAVLGGVAVDIGISKRPAQEARKENDGQDGEREQTPKKHVPS